MTVNLISETSWILGRCAQELADRLGWSINAKATADVEYHLPYWRGLDRPRPKTRVGLFTHGFKRALSLRNEFDCAVVMNRKMATCLEGMPTIIIRPGVDGKRLEPTFGVCGRTYGDGRKGEELVQKVVDEGYRVLSCGPGPWPSTEKHTLRPRTTHVEDRHDFYDRIDYLLVTSTDEGGPMPVVEAIAHGVPVIAPDVGWCWEFPVIRYDGTWESLSDTLFNLTDVPTWNEWVDAHAAFFELVEAAA